jgi:hypothetical protein
MPRPAAALACLFLPIFAHDAFAQQPGFSAADLPIVMAAYVEAVIDMRAAYETCAPTDKRPGEWDQGAALLVGSLGTAGLDSGTAATLEARLAAPVVPFVGDCAGEQVILYSGVPAGDSWLDYHRAVLGQSGIKIVEPGVNDARLTAVRAVVADALPKQTRMLVCMSLFTPQFFLSAFSDWNGLVAKAAQAFVAEGFGVEVYGPILDGALAGKLFAPPSDRPAAAADCMADREWLERFSNFAWYSFAPDVEAALKGTKP